MSAMTKIPYDAAEEFLPEEVPDDYDYPWVTAWGRIIGLPEHHIDVMLDWAKRDRAPMTALVKYATEDEWTCLEHVRDVLSRIKLLEYGQTVGMDIPSAVMFRWLDPDYPPKTGVQPLA